MRFRLKPWLAIIILAGAIFAVTAGIDWYRHRFVRSDADLFRFLPARDATLFYLNFAALRHAGVLEILAGTKPVEEAGYREFVNRTGFDYKQDLEALAGSVDASGTFCLLRGRFDWSKLRAYAGRCAGETCQMRGSSANRWMSFIEIQPDVMGLALAADRQAAALLRGAHASPGVLPQAPVWISLSRSLLSNPASLPFAVRLFAIALQSANPVVLSLIPGNGSPGAPFKLALEAQCINAAAADTIRNQLELDTKMLQLGLARQHIASNPADLTGLLTAGSFQAVDSRVLGSWPIRKQLLNALR